MKLIDVSFGYQHSQATKHVLELSTRELDRLIRLLNARLLGAEFFRRDFQMPVLDVLFFTSQTLVSFFDRGGKAREHVFDLRVDHVVAA